MGDVNRNIYGSRVKTDGEVIDKDGFRISYLDEDEFRPRVAFDGDNYFVIWVVKNLNALSHIIFFFFVEDNLDFISSFFKEVRTNIEDS